MAAQERARDVWIVPWFRDACQDIRFTVRSLIKDRAFTTASILILALGIGATTAIFSAVYAVLLQPLPYWAPQPLVQVLKKNPSRGWRNNPISAVDVIAWRQAKVLDGLAAFTGASCVLTGGGGAEGRRSIVAHPRRNAMWLHEQRTRTSHFAPSSAATPVIAAAPAAGRSTHLSTKVARCERATRAGLEVALERECALLVRELNADVKCPGPVPDGVGATAGVVISEARADVVRSGRCRSAPATEHS